jgi:hypothetical protein
MTICKTCVWWTVPDRYESEYSQPVDPDTYEPMESPFEVRRCAHPDLLFCERPLQSPGFAVADGSGYKAAFYTTEDFGCVLHQKEES